MNKLKLPLVIAAMLVGCFGIFAFTNKAPKPVLEQWYELKPSGNPMDRNDYEPAGGNPGCPSTHTSEVCGIFAVDDNGIPEENSFDQIVEDSDDFSITLLNKVQYRATP